MTSDHCDECRAHAGMVSRDRCEQAMEHLETELHTKIASLRGSLEMERRRLDAVCGQDGRNGRLLVMAEAIAALAAERKAVRAVALRLFIAAMGGSSLLPVIQWLLQ